MNRYRYAFILASFLSLLTACGLTEQENFDTPFVRIAYQESDKITMTSNTRKTYAYYVYLSSKPLTQNLEVNFDIEVGNGLTRGVDYDILTTGTNLTFPTGIYTMPIWIQWLPNPVDTLKNNTLKIVLKSNNLGFSNGFPGRDHNQSTLTITKVNP
jgi:hypothetical protein